VLFHTLDYLVFLPLTVFIYWGLPRRLRMVVLGLASLGFYASWNPAYLPVMLLVIGVGWAGGQWLARWRHYRGGMGPRIALMALLLLPLIFFKYWDWIVENIEFAFALTGAEVSIPRVGLALPIGISFFTFQALAYVIDVGRLAERGKDGSEPSLWRFTTFQTFFPQLVAGPIVRRAELMPQLQALPALQRNMVGAGIYRITRGMGKKLLVADVLRVGMVDPVFADPAHFTGLELMLALYAYSLQIYCDFSGYTDIAIGSARLFGIKLPENFHRPYLATNVAGFWRRWHLTLSNWVRDYIYFPLGGARTDKEWKVYRNIIVTMLIIGIWHGASWNFVVYGLLHGTAVCVARVRRKHHGRRPDDPLPTVWAFVWRWMLTFHFVVLARILFRAEDLGTSWTLLTGIVDTTLALPRFSPTTWSILMVGYAAHFMPEEWSPASEAWFQRQRPWVWVVAAAGVAAAALRLSTGDALSFVYYQF
jgi:D-alanyl-lipoteichoic acid acyltransferase DltB (MBOAT superfamily)